MNVPCPEPGELTRLLDGELTENRGALLRAHAASCRACAEELAAQRRLVARISAPLPGLPSRGAVAELIERLDGVEAASPRPARSGPGPRAYVGLAAAAVALVVAVGLARPGRQGGSFAARGPAVPWAQKVGVELWALDGRPRRLTPSDRLGPGVPVLASYSNVDAEASWLLAFAVDSRGDVHWLYPAWLDAARDPPAVRLEGSALQKAFAEAVVLEEVPDGALRFLTVVTRAPLRVSDVESVPPAERNVEALRRRWPDARIDELALRYASGPSAPGGRR